VPQGGCRPGGLYDLASKRWQEDQRTVLRSLFAQEDPDGSGGLRAELERESESLVSLYFGAFQAHADPYRRLWRTLSLGGSDLRAGYFSHEWRAIVWQALRNYRGRFFKIAMVASFDPGSRTFLRHWVSVTYGPQAEAWGDRTVLLDPWLFATPRIVPSRDHEKGTWLGTTVDPEIGPGGTLLDPSGRPVGGEIGPVE